ncbi:MAG: cytochrome P450 [Porticoccaceae bacterium]
MTAQPPQQSDHLIPLANLVDLSVGTLTAVNIDGVELVLVNNAGDIKAFEGHCPHMGTLLAEGELQNGELVCRTHHWRFDCVTGKKSHSHGICLAKLPLQIKAGKVLASASELATFARDADTSGTENSGTDTSGTETRDAEISFDPSINHAATQNVATQDSRSNLLDMESLPGPRPLPLLGNMLSIDRRAFHRTLEAWAQQYGAVYRCWMGRKSMVVVSDAGIANAILKARPDTFRRTSQLEVVSISGMNTHGVFMAEGSRWRKQRPVIMQSLDTRHLKQFFPVLVAVTDRLRRRWSGAGRQVVDVQSDLMRFTVDVTTSLAFGQDTNTLETEGDVIQQHLDKIFPTLQRRLLMPFAYWHYFRLPADREAEKSVGIVYQAVIKFIEQAKKALDDSPQLRENPENLLQSLLMAATSEDVAVEGEGFSEKEVADNVMTMLLAGEDTTANSLAWTIYFLVKYPEVQHKLRAEIVSVLGDAPIAEFEQLRDLPYLDGVIHEAMRLKPVAPLNVVEANVDCVVDNLSFKKGDFVTILARTMATNPSDFPDAQSYKPERWLANARINVGVGAGAGASVGVGAGDKGERQVNQRAFIPFGSGPRLCPGRSLALLEMKMVLVMMMQNFTISSGADLDKVREELSFTMSPQGLLVAFAALAD